MIKGKTMFIIQMVALFGGLGGIIMRGITNNDWWLLGLLGLLVMIVVISYEACSV